ncbi:MAG TPA: sulfatase-like hydrolase/transferase [Vicinamibacterales bacterium]
MVVGLAVGCHTSQERPLVDKGALRGANLLLVTIDTLRQDRVGAFGNRNGLTPTIDRLAANGVRFTHAFSTAPLTLPAHASILTGLLPRHHGIHSNTRFRLAPEVPTLATVAKAAGYRTGAFVGAFVLDGRFGLSRGFDEYDDRLPRAEQTSFRFVERRAGEVVAHAGDWILRPSTEASPWFAWVHLFDPHAPYDPPAEYRAGHAPYDGEIAYADAMLGALIERLRSAHALDHTLIIVTADHGESLGEHGETTHGLFAYDATLAVPLVLSGPSMTRGAVDQPVSHVDIAPTVAEILDFTLPAPVDGISLLGPRGADRPVFFEALDASLNRGWAPLRGVVQGHTKYIDLPEPELYDLSADPHELSNRIGRDASVSALQRILAPQLTEATQAPSATLDAEARSRLRSLGYTGGSAAAKVPGIADDPKRLVALNEQFNTAITAYDEGRSDQALTAFLSILRARPDFTSARTTASTILVAGGHGREAADLLRAGLAIEPASAELLARLGTAIRATGDLGEARDAFERARGAGDDTADLLNELAQIYAGLGHPDQARQLFQAVVDRNPTSPTSWFNLGLFELQNRRPADAASALRRATAIDPSYGDAWNALGAALAATDPRDAVDAWRHAERLLPGDYDLLFNLAMTLADGVHPQEALPYLQRFAKEAPRDRYAGDVATVRARIQRLGGHQE